MTEKTLYKVEEMLCEAIDEIAEKEHLNGIGDLQVLDTALHATKNLYKIMDSIDDSSYGSGESSYYSRRGGSYRGEGSYRGYSRDDGSYRGEGSYRRKRDSMGRFSRSGGDMVDRLKAMADETDDPQERRELHEFIAGVEHRA